MPIYRVLKCWGIKGGHNHYSHADIIARNHCLALKAAKEDRVQNWRWIDTFDIAPKDYKTFELLGRIQPDEAKKPQVPMPCRLYAKFRRLEEKIRAMDGVNGFAISQCDAAAILARRSRGLRTVVRDLVCKELGPRKIRFYYR